jgi:hypothetical protein
MKVSEMTDFQLAKAIAVGLALPHNFDEYPNCGVGFGFVYVDPKEHEEGDIFEPATDYDDIHRAEMELPEGLRGKYTQILSRIVMPGDVSEVPLSSLIFAIATATPHQRAEALVKTWGGGE